MRELGCAGQGGGRLRFWEVKRNDERWLSARGFVALSGVPALGISATACCSNIHACWLAGPRRLKKINCMLGLRYILPQPPALTARLSLAAAACSSSVRLRVGFLGQFSLTLPAPLQPDTALSWQLALWDGHAAAAGSGVNKAALLKAAWR